MGRELRRKQAKREGKSLEKQIEQEKNELKKFIIITLMLLIILGLIYLLSALFVTKELDWFADDEITENKVNVSNSILASSIFKQQEPEYYVYFYDFNEEKVNITAQVTNRLSSETLYKVDTSSAMNIKYVSDTSNKNAKNLEELKVVAPTLIKISNETIIEYYEKDEILANLN